MLSNQTEYEDMCNNRDNVRQALKSIDIALGKLKDGQDEGYQGYSIRDCIDYLKRLKSLLEESEEQ